MGQDPRAARCFSPSLLPNGISSCQLAPWTTNPQWQHPRGRILPSTPLTCPTLSLPSAATAGPRWTPVPPSGRSSVPCVPPKGQCEPPRPPAPGPFSNLPLSSEALTKHPITAPWPRMKSRSRKHPVFFPFFFILFYFFSPFQGSSSLPSREVKELKTNSETDNRVTEAHKKEAEALEKAGIRCIRDFCRGSWE